MPQLKIMGFDGVIPRTSATMLEDTQAQIADDVKLYSHEMRPWNGPTFEYTPLISNVVTIYKYYYNTSGSYLWFTWGTDVNSVQSPTADLTDYRLYYTGAGAPKKTNYTLATTGSGAYPRSYLNMGVPAPTTAPTVTPTYNGTAITSFDVGGTITLTNHGFVDGTIIEFKSTGTYPTNIAAGTYYYVINSAADTFKIARTVNGGAIAGSSWTGTLTAYNSADEEYRNYVYTYISTFGSLTEESAPSPASATIGVFPGNTVTVSSFATAPTTGYNITARRIYRTVTGGTTDTYEFVAEIPLATTSYTDSLTAAQLGEVLHTLGWVPPPSDLAGLVSHPSGALAGFSGNTVYFSEPFYAHAWPLAYAISVPNKIIGLGIYGQSVVVMTDRYPYIISGAYPGGMSAERVPILEPCVSKPSIFSDEFGVVYASPNGMVGIGPQSRGVITSNLFAYNEWKDYSPNLIAGAVTNNQYFAIYPSNAGGHRTMVINRQDIPALSFSSMQASAVHVDSKSAHLYYVDAFDNNIKHWDNDTLNPEGYQWRSKRFVLPLGTTFSALKLDADYDVIGDTTAYNALVAAIQARNTAAFSSNLLGTLNATYVNYTYYNATTGAYSGVEVNGSILENIPPLSSIRTVQVLIYGDGELQTVLDMTSFDPVRIPPFKSRVIEVEIVGTINVRSVAIATTVAELHQ